MEKKSSTGQHLALQDSQTEDTVLYKILNFSPPQHHRRTFSKGPIYVLFRTFSINWFLNKFRRANYIQSTKPMATPIWISYSNQHYASFILREVKASLPKTTEYHPKITRSSYKLKPSETFAFTNAAREGMLCGNTPHSPVRYSVCLF